MSYNSRLAEQMQSPRLRNAGYAVNVDGSASSRSGMEGQSPQQTQQLDAGWRPANLRSHKGGTSLIHNTLSVGAHASPSIKKSVRTPIIVSQSRHYMLSSPELEQSHNAGTSMSSASRSMTRGDNFSPQVAKAIVAACQHLNSLKGDEKKLRLECKSMKNRINYNETRIRELGEILSTKAVAVEDVEEDIARLQKERDLLVVKIEEQEQKLKVHNKEMSIYYENATREISSVKSQISEIMEQFDVVKRERYSLEAQLNKIREERIALESIKARKSLELSSLMKTTRKQLEELETEKKNIVILLDNKISEYKRIEPDKI